MNIPNIPTLPAKGLCESCVDVNCCFMSDMLEAHLTCVKEYNTWSYKHIDPASWDECSIDLPEFTDDIIEWCPMHAVRPAQPYSASEASA